MTQFDLIDSRILYANHQKHHKPVRVDVYVNKELLKP
jgi:hypothetical protein